MRIRIIKPYKSYKVGEIIEVSQSGAETLIKYGIGIISKDITQSDVLRDNHGRFIKKNG